MYDRGEFGTVQRAARCNLVGIDDDA